MSRCRRFEDEALLRIERGLPLDEHFFTCSDCLAARAAYERLTAGIAGLDAAAEPPERWQTRVWQRIETRRGARRRWWTPARSWLLAGGLAAAAALLLFVRAPLEQARAASLAVEVRPGGGVRRGAEARPGDRLVLRATTGTARQAELRVYRNDRELVLRCSDRAPCARQGSALRAELVLALTGRYQALVVAGDRRLPAPTGELDVDAARAEAAGAAVTLAPEIVVR